MNLCLPEENKIKVNANKIQECHLIDFPSARLNLLTLI